MSALRLLTARARRSASSNSQPCARFSRITTWAPSGARRPGLSTPTPKSAAQQAGVRATADEHDDVAILLVAADLFADVRRGPAGDVTEALGERVVAAGQHGFEADLASFGEERDRLRKRILGDRGHGDQRRCPARARATRRPPSPRRRARLVLPRGACSSRAPTA